MVVKSCPVKKTCWDKGACESCEFGKVFKRMNKRIDKLQTENVKLKAKNEELNIRIDVLMNQKF